MAKGFQNPDQRTGTVENAGRAALWPPQRRPISQSTLKRWKPRKKGKKRASFHADASDSEVSVHAPPARVSSTPEKVWRLRAPAYGLSDAPGVTRDTIHAYRSGEKATEMRTGPLIKVSPLDANTSYIHTPDGHSMRAIATHINVILETGQVIVFPPFRSALKADLGLWGFSRCYASMWVRDSYSDRIFPSRLPGRCLRVSWI